MISIKSWRPHRRFSLLPHGERSGRLRSRRLCGSLKFPLPSRRLHRVDSTFLPWAPLPSLRRHAAAGARFHKLARPSATARLRSHHVQQLLHSGLAWLGDQGVKSSSSSTASSTASSLCSRSQHRFGVCVCVHTPPCFQASCFRRWCRTSSVFAALPSRGGGHLPAAIGAAPPLPSLINHVRATRVVGHGVPVSALLTAPSLVRRSPTTPPSRAQRQMMPG